MDGNNSKRKWPERGLRNRARAFLFIPWQSDCVLQQRMLVLRLQPLPATFHFRLDFL